jgi:hypothetical protein
LEGQTIVTERLTIKGFIESLHSCNYSFVRFEVLKAVSIKNAVFKEYNNPVRTSHETHYVSATEPSQLMLCKIRDFHGGDNEECRLMRYNFMWIL